VLDAAVDQQYVLLEEGHIFAAPMVLYFIGQANSAFHPFGVGK